MPEVLAVGRSGDVAPGGVSGGSVHDVFELLAHEIRGPLSVIDGAVQTLQLRQPGPSVDQALLLYDMIRRNVALANRLLDRLAALRHAGAVLDLRHDLLDLRVLAGEVVADLQGSDDEAARRIRPVAGRSVAAIGDADAVREILHNLLRNALDHGARGPVKVGARRRDGQAYLHVRDEGPGIDAGDRIRVFELHERAGANVPGRGIGLAFGRVLARAQGGDLQLRPSDVGCTFELTLPSASAST